MMPIKPLHMLVDVPAATALQVLAQEILFYVAHSLPTAVS
jgi:hypothetical protein